MLGRALKPGEAAYVPEMIRRIAAILRMGPALDANYGGGGECGSDLLRPASIPKSANSDQK
ncbi:MAG: hypothetical protein ACRECU_04920 [Methylocella sp.]